MQRGCFLLAVVVVFVVARVGTAQVQPVDSFSDFDGSPSTADFSAYSNPPNPIGNAVGVVNTATANINFNGLVWEGFGGAGFVNADGMGAVSNTITINFDTSIDIVAFNADSGPAFPVSQIDITFQPANETLIFPLAAPGTNTVVGGRDEVNGITSISIAVTSGNPPNPGVLLGTQFRIESGLVPAIAVPANVNFGQIPTGGSTDKTIQIGNGGKAALTLNSLSIDNPVGSGTFTITTDPTPVTLQPGDTADVVVLYESTVEGGDTADLTINSSDPGSPTTVGLIGQTKGTPVLAVDPNPMPFGNTFTDETKVLALELENTGDGKLAITTITMEGGAAPPQEGFDIPLLSGDFPPAFPIMLAVGETKSFNVTFSPSTLGFRDNTIEIKSDGGDVNVVVTGTGLAPLFPEIAVNPTSVTFGANFLGESSSRPVTISNVGTGPLTVSDVTLTGPSRTQFSISGASDDGDVIPAGDRLILSLSHRPSQPGQHVAMIVITSDDADEGTVNVTARGTAIIEEKPEIAVSPEKVDFPATFVGTTATATVVVKNEGTQDLEVSNVSLTEDSDPAFSLNPDAPTSFTIVPGAEVPVAVLFAPTVVDAAAGVLQIASNDEDEGIVNVPLAGLGAPTPEPEIDVDTAPSLTFGQVEVGSSLTLEATVRNTGAAILDVDSIALSEDTSAEFTYDGPASVSLAPGIQIALPVTFTPVDGNYEEGKLVILSQDPDEGVIEVPISGLGVLEPVAKIGVETLPSLAYGEVMMGSPMTLTATIHNLGTAVLQVTGASISEGSSAEFSITDGPVVPVDIAPGVSVPLSVTYDPVDLGFDVGALIIDSTDLDNPSVTVSLTAFGVEAPVPAIEVTPEGLDFGEVEVGTGAMMSFIVKNIGSANLIVSSVAPGPDSSAAFSVGELALPPEGIAPQGEMPVDVIYAPTDLVVDTGSVVVESDDPDNPAVVVSVTGTGVGAPPQRMEVAPEALDFGNVEIGANSTLAFTVSNTGSEPLVVNSLSLGEGSSANFALNLPEPEGASILMLGGDEGPTFGADPTIFAGLVDGYGEAAALGDPGVFYMQGEVSTSEDGALVDVIFISSSLNSGTVRGKFEDATAGVLNYEQALMHDNNPGNFFMSDGGQTIDDQTQLDIVTPGHPLAAGLEGTVDVFTEPQTFSGGTGSLAPGVTPIAQATSDAGHQAIFAAEAGAELLGDGSEGSPATAAGRRVMFFLSDDGGNFLTENGQALLAAAVAWLVEGAADPVAVIDPGASADFEVTFTPSAEATDTGAVEIDTSAGSAIVSVMGTGVAAPVMQIRIAPPSLNFGGTAVGSTASADVTIRNVGTADLDLAGIAIGIGSSQDFNITAGPQDATVEPGSSTTVNVSYRPLAPESDSGTLRISSNDGRRPMVSVSLFGFGTGESVAPLFRRGDANSDATVDISDVVKTLMFLFAGGSEPLCHDAADSNDDGALDVSDGLFTVRRLFGGSEPEPLPPAADTCAIDTTNDDLPDCNYPLDACGM